MAAPQDTRSLDEAAARQVLAQALAVVGLGDDAAELIRLGSNVVFRLTDRPVIARVARSRGTVRSVDREIRVARWLADRGVPAVRALAVAQPVVIDGTAVGLWESVNEQTVFGSVSDLAALLRSLHGLGMSDLDLPTLDPVGRLVRRIDGEPALSADDRAFLLDRATAAAGRYEALSFALPAGPIHGDANVGNVLRDQSGAAVLIDLDDFCAGPREWDLVQTAMFYERFGWHTADEYAEFVRGYGLDLLEWPGYPVLRELRELSMVAWLAGVAGNGGERTEFDKRMASLRSGTGFDQWKPF